MLPIPIYIGISHRFDVIKGMTERSILEHTTAPVEITHLYPEVESGCTGFSDVRYQIRRGIYLDVDMVVLGDIADLWNYRHSGKFVCMEDGSTEVAVIDCEHNCRNKSEQHLLPKESIIPWFWNVEDHKTTGEIPDQAQLVHYTDMARQPWLYGAHPNPMLENLWREYV